MIFSTYINVALIVFFCTFIVQFHREQLGKSEIDDSLLEGNETEYSTNERILQNIFESLSNLTRKVQILDQKVSMGSSDNPALSCQSLYMTSKPSDYYWIQSDPGNPAVRLYCDMEGICCGSREGWMKVADIDMTNSNHQCPIGFKLITRTTPPYRACGRPDRHFGCISTSFATSGIRYSRVCGRILGYQVGSPGAFIHQSRSIDSYYIEGISLTHGQSPRKHIWSFATAVNEGSSAAICPCSNNGVRYRGRVPSFVGNDFFCDSAIRGYGGLFSNGQFHSSDPLWDGQGCGATSTCCEFNNPPWFCKELPQPTTDDIELRICDSNWNYLDDTPFEVVELFIH